MKKQFLFKIVPLFLSFLFISVSYAQEVKNVNCPNPVRGCDTVGVEQKISPWRVGGFLGPSAAFCGKWSSTFNSDKYRDKSLFNGIGFHANFNADYFFNVKKNKQLKFGVGAIAGLQTFFLRNDLDTFLDRIINESGSSNAVIQKGASEDNYIVAGPVLSYAFSKKTKSPFIEASVRGGLFRTTPAAIFVYDRVSSNNIYSVTATDKRYHAGLLATLGLFFPTKKGLWSWGVEVTGFRTKVNYIFPGATIYSYQRKHGGFSAGLAVRRNFVRDIPVKKAPTPPLICEAPDLEMMMGGRSIKGMVFCANDTIKADSIHISWKSRSILDSTKSETFTARLHQLANGKDSIIAQAICVKETKLVWPVSNLNPENNLPLEGQYYVTVQSQQISTCASCTSEVSTSGFLVKYCPPKPCPRVLYKLEVFAYKTEVKSILRYKPLDPTQKGNLCLCPSDTIRDTTYTYHPLKTIKIDTCTSYILNLDSVITAANIKLEDWVKEVYVTVDTTMIGVKNPEVPGREMFNYKAKVSNRKLEAFKKTADLIKTKKVKIPVKSIKKKAKRKK